MNKVLVLIVLFINTLGFSQTYGNEWINYNQKYFSFKIWKDGIYKIDYTALVNAGIPVNTISSANLQLFGFEKEQPILIIDGGDNSLDSADYILFYAQKNNTWLDSILYDTVGITNKYYPLYNDTITYFLSWNSLTTNKRILQENDVNMSLYSPSNYFYKTNYVDYNNYYSMGYNIQGVSQSTYTEGEGWVSSRYSALATMNYLDANIATPKAYTANPALNVTGEAVSVGMSNASTNNGFNHHLRLSYGSTNTLLADIQYLGFKKQKINFTFPSTDITASTTKIRHTFVNDLNVPQDYQSVAYVELTYPHLPDLENSSFFTFDILNHQTQSKTRLDLVNFNGASPKIFVIDGNQMKKIAVLNNAGTFQVLIPNSTTQNKQTIICVDDTQISSIDTITPVNGTGNFTDFTQTNFEDAFIIITNKLLENSALDYKSYRESVAGGNFNTVLAFQDELNMQFGGGVPKHSMGIRRFQHFAYNSATVKPNNVLLIGKGVREGVETQTLFSGGMRKSAFGYELCLVPTFGFPVSDMLYSNYLEANGWAPLIPIGRIVAHNNTDVLTYLNKVKEFEQAIDNSVPYTINDKYWQKNILHFGGGSNTSEQTLFRSYLNIFEQALEGPFYAGNVTSVHKIYSDPIDPVTLYNITDKINEGVSIMTYFGHAYTGGFDQNVDNVDNWDNKGKYPFLFSNSCLAGNIHDPNTTSVSEDFVIIPDKGCIAFLANVNSAFSSSLFTMSNNIFTNMSNQNYGATIGEIMKTSFDELLNGPNSPFALETTMSQFTLHGDPSLKVYPHEKPELEINQSGVYITPYPIDLTIDSIDVNIVIHNMGKASLDTFSVELTRSFPNNQGDSTYLKFINGINYNDTIVFKIPFYANIGAGLNTFSIKVDIPNAIDEVYDETYNNQIVKQVIFDVDGIYPVWPYEYAVVPNDTMTLKASTINPFATNNTYIFQIDTTDLFNSPELRYTIKQSNGGVVEVPYDLWKNANNNSISPLVFTDSTAYFWRTSVYDPTNMNWNESSFQYIKDKTGWGQSHFFQFKNNDFVSLNYSRPDRKIEFGPGGKTIECKVYGSATVPQLYYTDWSIDGSQQDYGACTYTPAIHVCVVDPITLEGWSTRFFDAANGVMLNPTHYFGNVNDNGACRSRPEKYFVFFQTDSMQMVNMQDMVLNQIPDSHYVLIYSPRALDFNEWDAHNPELYQFFQNLGSTVIDTNNNSSNVPYINFFKKGNASTFEEVIGTTPTDFISFQGFMIGYDYNGFETSTIIGPAKRWDAVYWNQYPLENPTTDTTRLKIYGITLNGTETLLIDTLFTTNDSITNFESLYSAQTYPYLKLQSNHIDTIDFTPSQINRWHVLYQHAPEAALTSTNGYYFQPVDTITEGQDLAFAFDIKNISDIAMDSLLVNYWIEDDQHQIIPIPYNRQDSLRVNGLLRDTLHLQTLGLKNTNVLWVEVNPYLNGTLITDQLEQYHFNNIGQIPFYVKSDDENPILDVTFNGYHILNGDIVAPNSEIVISLKDENPYLLMDSEADTANFGIYLTDPNGVQTRLSFRNQLGEPLMEWIPADQSNKKFKIIYQGDFKLNGTYRLLVQGVDRAGNLSGDFNYDIEFEVDLHSSITALMNYPNPFSTQTQFVFTLTGAVVPDEFTIQIMTISGKVVKEITIDELGPIHIGRNITDYRWNGTDEYGDILANGIYLYRVITKINGESIDHRESGADKYITKEFGKMYIIR
jgi:flagellar hook assembly protein FlgD